jgi:threonine/homoserine/homoserine lactone efflux protein
VIANVAAFVGIAAVLIATPGPDTALTIRNSLAGGRRGGTLTAAGVASGQAVWAVFTAAGLAALLRASQPAFLAIRIAGAAYLVYLGAQALVAALGGRPEAEQLGRQQLQSAFRQGLISNLSNPKMAVFFISVLPQFDSSGSFAGSLLLGLVFCSLTLAWLTGYAFVVARAGDFLRRRVLRRVLDALTGVALVALGLRLATERR